MPGVIHKKRLYTKCEVCGELNASFGFGVNLRRAMAEKEAGQIDKSKGELGKWYCAEHRGQGNERN